MEYDPHAAAVGGWILGSTGFCERVQGWTDEKERSREHPKRQRRLLLARVDLLVEIVRRETGVDEQSLTPWNRGPARKLIADLGHEECGVTFVALAELLGTSSWGAAKLRKRSQELRGEDRLYRSLREKIRTLLLG